MRKVARAVVIKDEAMLLIKRDNNGNRYYATPGGGLEGDETYIEAAERETFEETSVRCKVTRELYSADDDISGHQVYFLATYLSGTPALQPGTNEAIDHAGGLNTYEPLWLPLEQLPHITLYPEVIHQHLLEDLKKGNFLV